MTLASAGNSEAIRSSERISCLMSPPPSRYTAGNMPKKNMSPRCSTFDVSKKTMASLSVWPLAK